MFITIAYSFNNHASIDNVFADQASMIAHYDNWIDRIDSPTWEKSSGWSLDDWNKSKSDDYEGDAFVYFNDCVPGMLLVNASHRKPRESQQYATKRLVGYEITPEQANQIIADYGDCFYTVPYSELQHDDGSIYAIIGYNYEYGFIMSVHSSEESMLTHAQHIWNYGDLDEFCSGLVATPKWEKPRCSVVDDFIGESIPYMPIANMDQREQDPSTPFYNTIVGFKIGIKDLYRLT